MNIFRKWQMQRRLKNIKRDANGKFTDGNTYVWIALTPEVAREVHDAAMYHGQYDTAALVEPFIPFGGKVGVTVAQRSMIRRMAQDETVV